MKSRKDHSAQAGPPGHQGQDRQPSRDIANSSNPAPEPREAANARQVKSRSREALKQSSHDHRDELHPASGERKPR